MRRPPVTPDPWVIALVIIGLLGMAFTIHKATSASGDLTAPTRGAAR